MPTALEGLRVLDFSRILAGPYATMVLADLGATVTKVERPGSGDDTRAWGPPHDDAGRATYFQSVNRNKASVAIDLAQPAGRAHARRLASQSDVIVENFRPGVMDGLELGYAQLSAADPSIVYCSITGFGATGGAAMPGYDLLIQALGGLMSITGEPDAEPQKVGVAVVDVLAGLFASVGILAALAHRRETGAGQLVQVNLLSSLLSGLANQSTAFTAAGVVPTRMGNRHPSIAPYELLRCADRELVLAVGNDRQFAALCTVLGTPETSDDDRFATNQARVAHRSQLREILEARLAGATAADWAWKLTEARVPAGVINDIAGAFSLAESLGLDPIVQIPDETGRAVRLVRNPIDLSLTPARYESAPPPLPSEISSATTDGAA